MVFLVVAEMAKHVTFSRTYWRSSESCNERRQFLTHIVSENYGPVCQDKTCVERMVEAVL
jgi:hypothetical protein